MTRRPGSFPRTSLIHTAGLVLIAALLVASLPAQAGIGNPLKKVKEKLAQKVTPAEESTEMIGDDTVVFDDVVVELTNERLDRIVSAFKASKAAGTGRPAAVEKLNKAMEERNNLWDKHGDAIRELDQKRGEIETCYHDGYNEIRDRKTQEYSQKALTDPGIRERFMRVAQEQNAAAAKGDSAAIAKVNAVLYAEMLPSRDDSLGVRKKCGPIPPPMPAETRIKALDKEVAAQTEAIRTIDMNMADAQSKELKMKSEQFAMAMERIQAYMAWKNSKWEHKPKPPRGFTKEELDALEKHLEELRGSIG
ncbi:MAG TPA: hypothetical protein VI198_04335 [Candidatus Eisenbacteria bacterium]